MRMQRMWSLRTLLRQRAHPDLGIVHDGKVPFPVIPSLNRLPNCFCYGQRGDKSKSEKDNSGGRRKTSVEGKRAEIRIEGQNYSVLVLGMIQKHLVVCSGMGRLRPCDIVTVRPKPLYDSSGHVLVNEESHYDVDSVVRGYTRSDWSRSCA